MSNKVCDEYCYNCYFFSKINGGGGGKCCEFMLKTGKRRPCPPGTGCTAKVRMTKAKRCRGILADK